VKAFTRRQAEDEKPTSMVFDETEQNGLDILEWSRDGDTSARFQYRPDLPDEHDRQARVLLLEPHRHWAVVPKGSTIHINRDGDLELEIPEPPAPAPKKEEPTA
jgi:hypothetical protein